MQPMLPEVPKQPIPAKWLACRPYRTKRSTKLKLRGTNWNMHPTFSSNPSGPSWAQLTRDKSLEMIRLCWACPASKTVATRTAQITMDKSAFLQECFAKESGSSGLSEVNCRSCPILKNLKRRPPYMIRGALIHTHTGPWDTPTLMSFCQLPLEAESNIRMPTENKWKKNHFKGT